MAPRPVRRLLLPIAIAVEVALIGVLGAAFVLGALLYPIDRRLRLSRIAAFGIAYLCLELAGLAGFGAIWVARAFRSDRWYDAANRSQLRQVLDGLYGAAHRLLGFTAVVEDAVPIEPLATGQPVMVLARHGGLGDSFTLVWLLLSRYGRRPKVVLKGMLMWEPLIDVALNRMGACFLPGHAADREDRMAALARSLEPGDALLVFPEGGNWTPHRWVRAVARLLARGEHRAARAASLMENVLPPRPAGVLACLDARPELPVMIVAHTGLDKLTTVAAVCRAIPFGPPMTSRWWPAPPPPADDEGRVVWLTTEWAVVDEWIDAHTPSTSAPTFSRDGSPPAANPGPRAVP